MKKIAIYCVNYFSYDSLNDYLSSIDMACQHAGSQIEVSVFVADNSVPTETVKYRPRYFSIEVFSTGNNLGYFGAIEFAMKKVAPTSFDYIIISNVDVLMDKISLSELANIATDSTVGWIATALYSKAHHFDWNPQALKRYPLWKLKTMRFLFKHPFLLQLKQKMLHQYSHNEASEQCDIYAAHGSFIVLTNSFFEKCGIIHYPVFLYCEEIYLAEECKNHQLRVVYMPQIPVHDLGKVSTGKMSEHNYCKYNYQGINYIITKYY
jgi:GT2 family glycosyltransferase